MARLVKPSTREELESLPVVPYAEIRPELRTGDLLIAAGDYVFSHLIAYATRSPVTHTGIVVVAEEIDRVLLLEAVENFGVRLAPLSRLIWGPKHERYKGVMLLCRFSQPAYGVYDAAKWGLDELTRPYGTAKILALGARIFLGLERGSASKTFVCSEFAAEWIRRATGCEIQGGTLGYVTPAEIWQDPNVELVARVL